jgi:hypothetical protein
LRSNVRVEQSQRTLADLKCEFRQWLSRRRDSDDQQQYGSQLAALGGVIEVVINKIEARLPGFGGLPVGPAYEECRAADRQSAFVRHLWSYFRERWDQRDDPFLAPVLAAADEVVWSCYQPPFRYLDAASGPAPLPHISTDFSARAVRRILAPGSVRASDELLRQVIDKLPVPVIDLPHTCVDEPWWLVLIAHEVGHQIAYSIEEQEGPVIVELVGDAVDAAGRNPEQRARWRSWSHEIFADAYAAATVGAAHLWALVELERGTDATMVGEVTGYPPPIVRHELVACFLDRIGLPSEKAIPKSARVDLGSLDIPPDALAQAEELLAAVPAVATALAGTTLTKGATLPQLTGASVARLARNGCVGWWREQLAEATAEPEADLNAARLSIAGGIAEWARIAEEEEDAARRSERANALRDQLLATVPQSREPGYRAEPTADAGDDFRDLASWVAARVLRLPAEEAWGAVAR